MNRKSFQTKHLSPHRLRSHPQNWADLQFRCKAKVPGCWWHTHIWGEPRATCPRCQPSQHRPAHRVTIQPSPSQLRGENCLYMTRDLNCKGLLQIKPNPVDNIWNMQLVGLLEPRCKRPPLCPTAGRGSWAPSPCQHFHGWMCPAWNRPDQHWHSVQDKIFQIPGQVET